MKKLLSTITVVILTLVMFGSITTNASSDITYSDHLSGETRYEITDSSIAWVKQATGALIWVTEADERTDGEVINQAKNADPSLKNACKTFEILRGVGIKYTPNKNGSKTKVTVIEEDGKLYVLLGGAYSHFVKGDGGKAVAPVTPVVPETPEIPTSGEKISIRIDTAKKMAVRFEDGEVYYNGDIKEIEIGKEYLFQICSVNWENGIYDNNGNGLCGTVVYRMKVIHKDEFNALREIAIQNPDRYTVKGMDIIDNYDKAIVINCDAENFHLETDVNNFFMAYRFHFAKGDYNKQTGIKNVVNPTESLSVNLPLGATVTADAYIKNQFVVSKDILVENNSGTGAYTSVYLTSVNDYTWEY